jgi:hypothetical protein
MAARMGCLSHDAAGVRLEGGTIMASAQQGQASRQTGTRPLSIIVALAVAWLGEWAHELFRVPARFGLTPDGSLPLLAIAVIFLVWWLAAADRRGPTWALLVYGLVNAIGGFLTVLPLPSLPFKPEQTLEHYLIHVLYLACQVPLILLTLPRGRRQEA